MAGVREVPEITGTGVAGVQSGRNRRQFLDSGRAQLFFHRYFIRSEGGVIPGSVTGNGSGIDSGSGPSKPPPCLNRVYSESLPPFSWLVFGRLSPTFRPPFKAVVRRSNAPPPCAPGSASISLGEVAGSGRKASEKRLNPLFDVVAQPAGGRKIHRGICRKLPSLGAAGVVTAHPHPNDEGVLVLHRLAGLGF